MPWSPAGRPTTVIADPRVIEGYLGGSEAAILRSGDALVPAKATASKATKATKANQASEASGRVADPAQDAARGGERS